jgi:hypothetical protein
VKTPVPAATLTDRQLLEAIYATLSQGLREVREELHFVRLGVGELGRKFEATAGKVDALITDVRNLGAVTSAHRRAVDGNLTLARERVAELEDRVSAVEAAE